MKELEVQFKDEELQAKGRRLQQGFDRNMQAAVMTVQAVLPSLHQQVR